jgi:PAS domain S-box-containing protein
MDFESLLSSDQFPIAFESVKEIIETGSQKELIEYRIKHKDGHFIDIEVKGSLIYHQGEPYAIQGIARDITERKKTEEALCKSEEKYRSLVTNIPDVTWTTDIEGKTTFISPNVEKVYGFSQAEIYKRGEELWFGRIHPEDVDKVKKAFTALFKTASPLDIEYRIKRKNGDWIWLRDRSIGTYEKDDVMYADGVFFDITQQKLAEAALLESQKRLRTAQHIAHLGFWEWDLKTSELYWSDEAYHIYGLEADKINPTYDDFLDILHPDDKNSVAEAVDAVMHEKGELNIDHRILLPSGLERYVNSQGELIRDEKGTPLKMMGTMIDITDRILAEKETKKRNEELSTINTISGTINQTLKLKEVLGVALEETISMLEVEGGLIYLTEGSKNTFTPTIYYGFSEDAINSISGFSLGEGISGQAAELGIPLFVPNLAEDAQHISSAFFKDGWESLVTVPLKSKGNVVGVMTVSSRKKERFGPEDIGLLRAIGNQIGVAIENAKLYGITQEELTQRRHAERKVSEQNKFLKNVLESLTHPFYVVNVNNNLIEVANSAARKKGLSVGSKCHELAHNRIDPCGTDGFSCPVDEIKKTKKPVSMEHFHYDEKGNIRYFDIHAYPIFNEKGEVDRVIESTVDITDRKIAEAGLKEKDAQLRSVITAAPIVLWSLDKEGKFTLSEGKALSSLGLKPGEIVGQSVYDVYKEMPQIIEENERVLAGEEFSSSLRFADLVWETSYSPLRDNQGKVVGSIGVARDITQRLKAESDRKILFRELKHRVKNNLQLLSSMVDMQILRSDDKALISKLQEIQSVIDTIALIYSRAYEGSQLLGLNLNNFIEELFTALLKFKSRDELIILHSISGDNVKLNTDQAIPMALIANELMFNALKHAFNGQSKGNIHISLKKDEKEIIMSIADDGMGINSEVDLKKPRSFGLKIVNNLVEQLNGTLDIEVKDGTKFTLRIPSQQNGE